MLGGGQDFPRVRASVGLEGVCRICHAAWEVFHPMSQSRNRKLQSPWKTYLYSDPNHRYKLQKEGMRHYFDSFFTSCLIKILHL